MYEEATLFKRRKDFVLSGYENTRCLIDADGTLFDSFPQYNIVVDSMFKGTMTDRSYNDYWGEFNNAYDIIPGTTWKTIFSYLVRFLDNDRRASESELNEYEKTFNEKAVKWFSGLRSDEFIIKPVIDWCRDYVSKGGQLAIHSGTNRVVLEAMLKKAGIGDLFIDYINSDTLGCDNGSGSNEWAYKVALVQHLVDRHPANGRKLFVIGDTKGDGYGAYACKLPFAMMWRGYPKMPYVLGRTNSGNDLKPYLVVDMRQDVLDRGDTSATKKGMEELVQWIENDFEKIPEKEQAAWNRCH